VWDEVADRGRRSEAMCEDNSALKNVLKERLMVT
jgi:hypothetical protein